MCMAYDFIQISDDAKSYSTNFLLWKTQWEAYQNPSLKLSWEVIKFDSKNQGKIPQEKGLYAFTIKPSIANLGLSYLIYIGQTGDSLQNRFKDYLQVKRTTKRPNIARYLKKWDTFIYFYYIVIEDYSKTELKNLETKLLDAFTPPLAQEGYSAKVKKIIKGLK